MRDTRKIVAEVVGHFFVPGHAYPSPLPRELEDWYVYTSDFGHNVVCVLRADYQDAGELTQFMLPVPVKAVLRGYEIRRGYVVVDLPYSRAFGLEVDPADSEI